jgi:hypothetical protein
MTCSIAENAMEHFLSKEQYRRRRFLQPAVHKKGAGKMKDLSFQSRFLRSISEKSFFKGLN